MRAVIFDVDGVLVDSYQAHLQSWQQFVREQGDQLSEERFAQGFGRTSRELMLELWPERDLTPDELTSFDTRKEQLFREIIERDYPVMTGAVSLWNQLHAAGFSLGVGSSGPPNNVHLAMQHIDPGGLAGCVVTGADVSKGKPDPEVFLRAAAGLGVDPGECVVIEDAAPGLMAAKAAGMKCVGFVSTGRSADQLRMADLVVSSHSELSPTILRGL